jgi:diguanylate cyclase (GGDEF)-like protein/PAS domain S-box-containing protein
LFKNTLFLKIILIFTLPALGILYFSSVLVYDKIESFNEVSRVQNTLDYLKSSEKFLSSLQKERELTINYFLLKIDKDDLKNQRLESDEAYKDLEKKISFLSISANQPKFEIDKLKNLRIKIDNFKIKITEVINDYSEFNKSLLNSVSFFKPIKLAYDFNDDFRNIIHFLNFKEATYLEKILINISILNNTIDDKLYEMIIKNYSVQETNKDYFFNNTNLDVIQKYNSKLQEEYYNKIFIIRSNIKNKNFSQISLSYKDWETLSNKNLESLNNIYNNLILSVEKFAVNFENEAVSEKNKSLFFLFVCFSTLISLLFVLRSIIFNEQNNFYKIQKHKDIYKLLNKANKFFLNIDNKKRLYSNISELLLENNKITFSFIYDLFDNQIIAQEGDLKNRITEQMSNYSDTSKENIVSRTMKWETNIIINNFEKKNISIFYNDSQDLNIKSMASFPIIKFNKIIGVLILYSNEKNFFDDEIEILFDKLISDITHCLEKIDYEEIRINQEDELRLSSYAFESSEPMIITNEIGQIIKVNQAFCTTMGFSKEEIIGKNPRIFKSLHQDKKFVDILWSDLKVKGFWSGEVYNKKANDEIIPLRSTITAIKNNYGKITHYLGQYIDIAEQKDKEKILEYQATHDNLTGLPNRLLLLDRIEHAITKIVRHNIVGGLIFIDLDNFKEVNDTLGHDIGDLLLIMVSKTIKEIIREEDTIARIGGDEFIILLDNIGNDKEIAKTNILNLAEKIKDSLNAITHINGNINVSTPSIGITLFNDASVSIQDIIKQADTAMYIAKKQGKNSIEFF